MNRSYLVALVMPALAACIYTTTTVVSDLCRVDATLETTGIVHPGDSVSILAHPLTSDFDTLVLVDGIEADAFVDRTDCALCDACLADEGCDPCTGCDECEAACNTCAERVTFVVPDVAGAVPVALINSYGAADLALDVFGDTGDTDLGDSDDTGLDTGDTDTGLDTGDTDTGDTGLDSDTDTGVLDTDGAGDTDPLDTDVQDTDTDI